MKKNIIEFLVRWRTWIVNSVAAVVFVIPELLYALLGFNWGEIIDAQYMPYVTLVILILNVWMRPRPAVISSDVEAYLSKED